MGGWGDHQKKTVPLTRFKKLSRKNHKIPETRRKVRKQRDKKRGKKNHVHAEKWKLGDHAPGGKNPK